MANDKYRSPYEAGSEQASELDEHHDDGAYNVDDQPYADEDKYRDEAKRVRRPKLVVAMVMFSLGLAGTAAAFGYRAICADAAVRFQNRKTRNAEKANRLRYLYRNM